MNHVEVYTRMSGPMRLSTASRMAGCRVSAWTQDRSTCVRDRYGSSIPGVVRGPPTACSNSSSLRRWPAATAGVSAAFGDRNPSRAYRSTSADESFCAMVIPSCEHLQGLFERAHARVHLHRLVEAP